MSDSFTRLKFLLTGLLLVLLCGCGPAPVPEIHIGFIGPLTGNAVDLGEGPARAMELAVAQYNESRGKDQPKAVLHIEDDEWVGANAVPLYDKLRREHGIQVLLMSHTDGTIALQERAAEDGVILINSLNNDQLLSTMNENTFVIGKKTEEAAQVVAGRLIETGKRQVRGFHVTNSFMTIFADSFSAHVERHGIDSEVVAVDIGKTEFRKELQRFADEGCDALVFFGYRNLGFAMKQARELGMDVPFFGATTLLGAGFYENSEGVMDGTEFSFFTPQDGNYVLANRFLDAYELRFGEEPFSVWPAMQGYDAMNLTLDIVGRISSKPKNMEFSTWFKSEMYSVKYYQGICGNIAIQGDGTSRGIYFSLYEIKGHGVVEKVRR